MWKCGFNSHLIDNLDFRVDKIAIICGNIHEFSDFKKVFRFSQYHSCWLHLKRPQAAVGKPTRGAAGIASAHSYFDNINARV